MRDMIVDSSNDATGLVVDVLTGTTSGPELPPNLKPGSLSAILSTATSNLWAGLRWKRLTSTKTWGDGLWARTNVLGELMENRNMLTTCHGAVVAHSIVGGVAVSRARSQSDDGVNQTRNFLT